MNTFPLASTIASSILCFMYVFLTILIIRARRINKIPIGTGECTDLQTRSAAHENFGNYAPFFLILLFLFEIQSSSNTVIASVFAGVFCFGRVSHAFSVLVFEKRKTYTFRVLGMVCTFIPMMGLAFRNIWFAIGSLI
jgi:uncharacterized protein